MLGEHPSDLVWLAIIFGAIVYLTICAMAASAAHAKGQSSWNAFALSLFFSPILGFLYVAALPIDQEALDKEAVKRNERKLCPSCLECPYYEAKVCRYCGYSFKTGEGTNQQ